MKQKPSAASHVSGLESECYCNALSDIAVSDATIRNNHDVMTRNKYYSCIHAMQCNACTVSSTVVILMQICPVFFQNNLKAKKR